MNELYKYIESRENALLKREEVENLVSQVMACYFNDEISADAFLDMVYLLSRIEIYKFEQIDPRMRDHLEQILIKHTDCEWVEKKANALLCIAINLDLTGLMNKIKNTADCWYNKDMSMYDSIWDRIYTAEKDIRQLRCEIWKTDVKNEETFSDSIRNAVSSRRAYLDDRIRCWYSYPIVRNKDSLQKEVEFLEMLESAGLRITDISFEELHDWDDWHYDMRSYRRIDELKADTEAMGFIGGTWKAGGRIDGVRIDITLLDSAYDSIYVTCKMKDHTALFELLCAFEKLYHA